MRGPVFPETTCKDSLHVAKAFKGTTSKGRPERGSVSVHRS
jgi:hypothetical protein